MVVLDLSVVLVVALDVVVTKRMVVARIVAALTVVEVDNTTAVAEPAMGCAGRQSVNVDSSTVTSASLGDARKPLVTNRP